MTTTRITSPFPFEGETTIGPLDLTFVDGVATFPGVLSQDASTALRNAGFTVEAPLIGDADTELPPAAEPVEEPAPGTPRPPKNASKSDWEDYAVEQGHDRGSLDELTRDQIIGLFDE